MVLLEIQRWLFGFLGKIYNNPVVQVWWFTVLIVGTALLFLSNVVLDLISPADFVISSSLFLQLYAFVYLLAFYSYWVQSEGLVGSNGILPVEQIVSIYRAFQKSKNVSIWQFPLLPFWYFATSSPQQQKEREKKGPISKGRFDSPVDISREKGEREKIDNEEEQKDLSLWQSLLQYRTSFDQLLSFYCISGCVVSLLISSGASFLLSPLLNPFLFLYLFWAYMALKTTGREWTGLQFDCLIVEGGVSCIFIATAISLYPLSFSLSHSGMNDSCASSSDLFPFTSPLDMVEISWMGDECVRHSLFNWLIVRFGSITLCLTLWSAWLLLFRIMFSSGIVKLSSGDLTWRDGTAMLYHYWSQPLAHPISWYWHHLIPKSVHILSTYGHFIIELFFPYFIFFRTIGRAMGGLGCILLMLLITSTGCYGFFNFNTIALCMSLLSDEMLPSMIHYVVPSPSSSSWIFSSDSLNSIFPLFTLNKMTDGTFFLFGKSFFFFLQLLLFFISVSWLFLNAVMGIGLVKGTLRGKYNYPPCVTEFFREGRIGRMFRWVKEYGRILQQFSLFCPYGLFSVMTTDRGEIILEGSNDGTNWELYEFPCKPSRANRKPSFGGIGYFPRLDWRMWFLQFTSGKGAWFEAFIFRLLSGNNPAVFSLLHRVPFPPDSPPRFIRYSLRLFEFSDWGSQDWWKVGDEVIAARMFTLSTDRKRLVAIGFIG